MGRTATLLLSSPLVLLLACAPPGPASDRSGPQVEIRISKPHALLVFAQTIAGDPHRSPILLDAFRGSEFDDERTTQILRDFDEARAGLRTSVSFAGYPAERHAGRSLDKFLLLQSVFADDLDGLARRSTGLLPMTVHRQLFGALRALEPVYDTVVWGTHEAGLRDRRDQIEEGIRDWGIDKAFEEAVAFYGADWPNDLPFVVALYPLPASSGVTSAESIANIESVGVLTEERDLADRFGVIFHELCHSLWEAQPPELQHDLERWFVSHPSRHARLAYQHVNEALATALGNGRAYEKAAGKPDEGSWYNDELIDGFAREIRPLVDAYVDGSTRIDEAFVAQAIERLERKFPEAIYEYGNVLDKVVLLLDGRGMALGDATAAMRTEFSISSVASSIPIDHPRSLEHVRNSGETLVAVVSGDGSGQLQALAGAYAPIGGIEELPGAGAFVSGVDERGRAWIVVHADTREQLEDAVAEMKRTAKIPNNGTTVSGNAARPR